MFVCFFVLKKTRYLGIIITLDGIQCAIILYGLVSVRVSHAQSSLAFRFTFVSFLLNTNAITSEMGENVLALLGILGVQRKMCYMEAFRALHRTQALHFEMVTVVRKR